MPQILLAYAALSVAAVLASNARAERRLRDLTELASDAPEALRAIVRTESLALEMATPRVVYLGVPQFFCFATSWQRTIMVSRGFFEAMPSPDLRLAMRHELVHVKRFHGEKGLAWRIVTSALLLPGFERIERWRHARREAIADRESAGRALRRYRRLLVRSTERQSDAGGSTLRSRLRSLAGRPAGWPSLWPAVGASALLLALVVSHFVFMANMPYLLAHHC